MVDYVEGVEYTKEKEPGEDRSLVRTMKQSLFMHQCAIAVWHYADALSDEELLKGGGEVERWRMQNRFQIEPASPDWDDAELKVDLAPYHCDGDLFIRARKVVPYNGDGNLLAVVPDDNFQELVDIDIRSDHFVIWSDRSANGNGHTDAIDALKAVLERLAAMLRNRIDKQTPWIDAYNEALPALIEKALANRRAGITNVALYNPYIYLNEGHTLH